MNRSISYTMWRMIDGSTRLIKVPNYIYERFAHKYNAVGDAPGRPSKNAIFLMAAGGCDDIPNYQWKYSFSFASPPLNGLSLLTEFISDPKGTRWLRRFVLNHRSVTFDAASSGTAANANSLTISHTVTTGQSNLYICGMPIVHTNTLTSSSYNAVSMTTRDSNTGTNFRPYYTDLINPSTGTNNGVFTPNAKSDLAGGFISAYGVDQTTPRRATANANGNSTTPSLTVTSGVGDLVVSNIGYDGSLSIDTLDTFWVTAWNITTGPGNTESAGMRISGASPTQVRNDSFNLASAWAMVGASIQSPTSGFVPRLTLLGAG